MDIKAFKMDGLGNDFLIIDRRKKSISIKKEKIIELGKRENIGFDQLIFIDEIDNITPSYNPITIYNSDFILALRAEISYKLLFIFSSASSKFNGCQYSFRKFFLSV